MADDVHWLKSQGGLAEKSFMFVVDSAMRDKLAYPTPSDYVVPLPIPLRNVFSVDLVDATIPRTEYSVERATNTLVIAVTQTHATVDAARAAGVAVTVSVPPGNYNLLQLVQTVDGALVAACLARSMVPVRAETVGDPPDLTNRIRLSCSSPFSVFMDVSTIRGVLGFGNPSHAAGGQTAYDGAPNFTTTPLTKQDVFFSVPVTSASKTTYAGPVPVEQLEYSETLSPSTPLTQRFTATESGVLSGGGSGVILNGVTTRNAVIDVVVRLPDSQTPIATLSLNAVASTRSWIGTFTSTGATQLIAGTVYAIDVTTEDTDATIKVYRSETFTDDAEMVLYVNDVIAGTGTSEVYGLTNALSLDLTVSVAGHAVTAPGQCDLTGERYLLVRSPDIEQHMNRDLACAFDRMAPGMGMCKLGGFGFREERFNFLAYSSRSFHPIGKLREMHIRLEKRNGQLYDAHGIDHVLLFVAKMLVASVPDSMMLETSVVNPAYDPDIRRSLIKKLERERD